MTIARLTTTSRSLTPEAAERARAAGQVQVRCVEAAEGTEADRQRSLQQEIDEVQARAVGPFEGEEQVLQSARDLAEKLVHLTPEAAAQLSPDKGPRRHAIDAEA